MTMETYKGMTLVQMKIIANQQRAEIAHLRDILAAASDKLSFYRANHSGEYVGGTEYATLKKRIDAALT